MAVAAQQANDFFANRRPISIGALSMRGMASAGSAGGALRTSSYDDHARGKVPLSPQPARQWGQYTPPVSARAVNGVPPSPVSTTYGPAPVSAVQCVHRDNVANAAQLGPHPPPRCASPWAVSSSPHQDASMPSSARPSPSAQGKAPSQQRESSTSSGHSLEMRTASDQRLQTIEVVEQQDALPQFGQAGLHQAQRSASSASLEGKSAKGNKARGGMPEASSKQDDAAALQNIIRDFKEAMERDLKEIRVLADSPELQTPFPLMNVPPLRFSEPESIYSDSLYSSPVTSARTLNRTARRSCSLKALAKATAEALRHPARSRSGSPSNSVHGGFSRVSSMVSLTTGGGGSITTPAATLSLDCDDLAATNEAIAKASRQTLAVEQLEVKQQRNKPPQQALMQYERALRSARRRAGPPSCGSDEAVTRPSRSLGMQPRRSGMAPTHSRRFTGSHSNASSKSGSFIIDSHEEHGNVMKELPSHTESLPPEATELATMDANAPEVAAEPVGQSPP